MKDDKQAPIEIWVTFKPYHLHPLGPCTNILKYVATFAHEHGAHFIAYENYETLKKQNEILREALTKISKPHCAHPSDLKQNRIETALNAISEADKIAKG